MTYSLAIIRPNELGQLMAAGIVENRCWFTWSDDGGTTWDVGRRVTLEMVDSEQPGLAELPDGSLRIAVTQSDAVRIYGSENAGESWTAVAVLT